MHNLAEPLAVHMMLRNYMWRVDGHLTSPSPDDIQRVINRATDMLAQEEDNSQLEIGHLIFKKREGVIDIFVHFGEIDAED